MRCVLPESGRALGPLGRTVFAHGNEVWQEYSYLGGMDAIALGCLTAIAISRTTIPRSTWFTNKLKRLVKTPKLHFLSRPV